MERNIVPQNKDIANSSPAIAGEAVTSGSALLEGKIQELSTITATVRIIFEKEKNDLQRKLIWWIGISAFLIIGMGAIYYFYLFAISFPDKWSWQIIYYAIIRVTFITLYVSLIAFCLKVLKSYLHLYEHNKHKLIIVKAMPTLIYATNDNDQSKAAYSKILDTILHGESMGIINGDTNENSVPLDLIKELVGLVKK